VNADDHEAQREALAAAIHKRMRSSYIGAPPPLLRGDAERAVWAVIHEGWSPPVSEELIDHVWGKAHALEMECQGWARIQRGDVEWILAEAAKGVPPEGEE
jgi:hypothetical protein